MLSLEVYQLLTQNPLAVLPELLGRNIFTDDGRLINVKGMLELENYHFVITKEIVDSGKDHYQ